MSYNSSNGHILTAVTYSAGQSAGVSVLVATSCFSLVAIVGLFVLMGAAVWTNRTSENKNYFFRTNIAPYFICLLASDLLQAIGSIMNARWVQSGGVSQGQFCSAQAVLKHLSDIGSAGWSLAISVQTFCLLFYQLHTPRWVGLVVLVCLNSFMLMITALGPAIYGTTAKGDFYGVAGYWCWITGEYDLARVTLDYMILFLSAFLSFILYTLVFFRLRGNIIVTGWHVRFQMLEDDDSGWRGRDRADSRALSVGKQMILYPVAYTILLLPIAVLRMCEWAGHQASFSLTMFCDSIFLLSGVVNVVLFCTIRRVIPVKQVVRVLITGKVFQPREDASMETTWCIGSVENGEKDRFSTDLSLPDNDDSFALRQPKFDIVAPPPAVLSDKPVAPTIAHTVQTVPTYMGDVAVHVDLPRPPVRRPSSVPTNPLPRQLSISGENGEGHDRSSSFFHQSAIRRLPPIPQAFRPPGIPSSTGNREDPPPADHPAMTHHRQYSVSGSVPSHSHSRSIDSVASDASSTLFGSTHRDSLRDDDFLGHH